MSSSSPCAQPTLSPGSHFAHRRLETVYSRRKGGLLEGVALCVDDACDPEGEAAPWEVGEKEAENPTGVRDDVDPVRSERSSSVWNHMTHTPSQHSRLI